MGKSAKKQKQPPNISSPPIKAKRSKPPPKAAIGDVIPFIKNLKKSPYMEYPLLKFEEWYADFDFAKEVKISQATLKVVMLDRSFVHAQTETQYSSLQKEYSKHRKLAEDFFLSSMTIAEYSKNNKSNKESLKSFMDHPTSIIVMIIMMEPTRSSTRTNSSPKKGKTNTPATTTKVVCAALFDVKSAENFVWSSMPRMLSKLFWLGVAPECNLLGLPGVLKSSWYIGFGKFMLMLIVKISDAKFEVLEEEATQKGFLKSHEKERNILMSLDSEIYVQACDDGVEYFLGKGFHEVTNPMADEDSLFLAKTPNVPVSDSKTLANLLLPGKSLNFMNQKPKAQDLTIASASHLNKNVQSTDIIPVDTGPHSIEDVPISAVLSAIAPDKSMWCIFPLPSFCVVNENDLLEVLNGKPLLSAISPFVKGSCCMSDLAIPLQGEVRNERMSLMRSDSQLWINSGELDFMFAFLLRHDIYAESVSIISSFVCRDFYYALEAFEKCMKIVDASMSFKENGIVDQEAIDALIVEKFGINEADQLKLVIGHTNKMHGILFAKDRNIFHKKLIVFPENENGNHWKATFVFNPSVPQPLNEVSNAPLNDSDNADEVPSMEVDKSVSLSSSLETKYGQSRFFFRYDPFHPDGQGKFKREQGLIFLLNVLSSWDKSKDPSIPLKPSVEFGSYEREGFLAGTETFPALILDKEQSKSLPLQSDSYNCGFAVVAAIGIIMNMVNHPDFAAIISSDKIKIKDGEGPQGMEKQLIFSESFPDFGLTGLHEQLWLADFRSEWLNVFDTVHVWQRRPIAIVPERNFSEGRFGTSFLPHETVAQIDELLEEEEEHADDFLEIDDHPVLDEE